MLNKLRRAIGLHPKAWWHALGTYPRFLGRIKPELLGLAEKEAKSRWEALQRCWEFRLLEAPVGKRLLVVSPHPDDESIGCGGLLLAHRGLASVHVVTLFNGEGGGRLPEGPWRDEPDYKRRIVELREQERSSAAAMLGLKSIDSLNLPDGFNRPTRKEAEALRKVIDKVQPDVVLIPWYLDSLSDHRMANVLYAWGCSDLACMVLGFEVWTLCPANAVFAMGALLAEKLRLVSTYQSQLATVDYAGYVEGLAKARGFLQGIGEKRNIPAEGYLALPNRDYCEIVKNFYGEPFELSPTAKGLFEGGPT